MSLPETGPAETRVAGESDARRAEAAAVVAWLDELPVGRAASPEELALLCETEAALAGGAPMASHASVIAAARARFPP